MKKIVLGLFLPFVLIAAESVFVEDDNKQNTITSETTNVINKMINLKALQNSFFLDEKKRKKQNGNSDNILNIKYEQNKTYRIRTRYAMDTLLILHNDKVALSIPGDEQGFQVTVLNDAKYNFSNMIKIRPLLIGVDTSLTIIGESGNVYSFYLFSTDYENKQNPNLIVFVSEELESINRLAIKNLEEEDFLKKQKKTEEQLKTDEENLYITIGDGINEIKIDKRQISRDYVQKGEESLKAYDIFRDNKFTYFKYDKNNAAKKFPVVYRVVDGYDNPVNTRIVGDYIIAETVEDKFTLRNGDKYVCVRRKSEK
jgi:type IV secretion system protein VirB9/ComB9 competence protein